MHLGSLEINLSVQKMPLTSKLGLLAAALLAVSGCASSRSGLDEVALATEAIQAPDLDVDSLLRQPYLLHPADVVAVDVFRVPDLSGQYALNNSGNIIVPLLGEIPAAGMTEAELGRQLEQLYGSRYLEAPSVTVQIAESVGNRFSVDGAVQTPGVFNAVPGTTLLQSIAMARGLDDSATQRVVILRRIGGDNYAAGFDLGMVRRGEQPNPDIYGGDVIVVDGRDDGLTTGDIFRFVPLVALFTRIF